MVQRPVKPQEEAIDENAKYGRQLVKGPKAKLYERSRRTAEKISGPEDTKIGQNSLYPNNRFKGYVVKSGNGVTVREKNIEPIGPAAKRR